MYGVNKLFAIAAFATYILNAECQELYPVAIIHFNDFHARFEETNTYSNECRASEGEVCIGGYARVVTTVKSLLEKRKDEHPIYLNAGDNFQGTLWYNLFRWNVTAYFLNMLPADVMTIGNHEFDNGVAGVVPFLETIKSPIVIANVDDELEPDFQGKYQKTFVIDKYDRKIGVIGVILQSTDNIADTGNLKFYDESETVRREAALMKEQGINIVIVLSHCGLDVDRIIAENGGPDIDVIVGGHSHTFMFTGFVPPEQGEAYYPYPLVVEQSDGHKVYIVQASAYTKYIGDFVVYFDENGEIQNFSGNPIYLDSGVIPDPQVAMELLPWKEEVDKLALQNVGTAKVHLTTFNCNYEECNMGNIIADSFVDAFVDLAEEGQWTYSAIAVINVGSIRTTLDKGDLNYGNLIQTLPFENTLQTVDLKGEDIIEALEWSVTLTYEAEYFNAANMLHHSGLKVVFNVTNPIGERVVSVHVLCNNCAVPKYEPIELDRDYRVICPSFLANGGDGFYVFQEKGRNKKVHMLDIDAFEKYVVKMSPIMTGSNGRVKILI